MMDILMIYLLSSAILIGGVVFMAWLMKEYMDNG